MKGKQQSDRLTTQQKAADGGIIEVRDDNGKWHVVVVSEAKFQGKDIDNLKAGIKVGKNNDQDLMAAIIHCIMTMVR